MTSAELGRRIERLERDNRRLKAVAFGILVMAAALGGIYATRPVPRKVTAREFDVVDGCGRARVIMRVQRDGMALIEVYGVQGGPRALIGTPASGEPSIEIFGPHGRYPAASIGTTETGAGSVTLNDAKGQPRAGMAAANLSGSSGIWLRDPEGKPLADMTVGGSGAPRIRLSDAEGFSMTIGGVATENRRTGGTGRSSVASIVMFGNDKDHHVIWQAP